MAFDMKKMSDMLSKIDYSDSNATADTLATMFGLIVMHMDGLEERIVATALLCVQLNRRIKNLEKNQPPTEGGTRTI